MVNTSYFYIRIELPDVTDVRRRVADRTKGF